MRFILTLIMIASFSNDGQDMIGKKWSTPTQPF
jgi:hypothetical protein